MDETAWAAIRPNLATVAEAADWWRVVTGPFAPPELPDEDRAFVAEAARMLGWTIDPWRDWTA